MKSARTRNTVNVLVLEGTALPPYLTFAQRSFEKSMPVCGIDKADLEAPVDLLKVVGVDDALMANTASITLHYRKRVK